MDDIQVDRTSHLLPEEAVLVGLVLKGESIFQSFLRSAVAVNTLQGLHILYEFVKVEYCGVHRPSHISERAVLAGVYKQCNQRLLFKA